MGYGLDTKIYTERKWNYEIKHKLTKPEKWRVPQRVLDAFNIWATQVGCQFISAETGYDFEIKLIDTTRARERNSPKPMEQ